MTDNSTSTIKAGVIGWPIAHSLSPRLHGYWLDQQGIAGTYQALPVQPEQLAESLTEFVDQGYAGLNVTVPHKETVMVHLDEISDAARRIGAVNTLVFEDGVMKGSNTDGFGFMENLKAGHAGFDASRGPAVVLGAGGAARAVVAALTDAGVPEIRLLNRTRDRAEALAEDLSGPITVGDWDVRHEALDGAALLVNTTTLGMTGKPPLELMLDDLPRDALVNDIVYAPLQTGLLAGATARGNPVVDGIGMLLHQARPGFAAWFGVEPQVTDGLRAHVLAGMAS